MVEAYLLKCPYPTMGGLQLETKTKTQSVAMAGFSTTSFAVPPGSKQLVVVGDHKRAGFGGSIKHMISLFNDISLQ